MKIQNYNFKIVYRKGSNNRNANEMSKLDFEGGTGEVEWVDDGVENTDKSFIFFSQISDLCYFVLSV
jgi:hypothetical protein